MTPRVAIAGAGIGGLCLALALARHGIKSVVLEQAKSIKPVGAGIQLSPNASHCLQALDVLDGLSEAISCPQCVLIRSGSSGKALARVPLGGDITRRHGAPYIVIHRGDLQLALLKTAEAHPKIDVRLGSRLTGCQQTPEAVYLEISSPGTSGRMETACLIGADGVWSATRKAVPGAKSAAFTGRVAYRASIPADQVPPELLSRTGLWLAQRTHLVHYPICGGQLFNLVALTESRWRDQSWSVQANPDEVLAAFGTWCSEARDLLSLPKSWLKWALCGVPGNNRWADGRITLLGDAAHGMLPFVAQGAAMAIEDALVLAEKLAENSDVTTALASYEAIRKPRAERVQAEARKNDRIYHLGAPWSTARNLVMASKSSEDLLARMDWIYGWRPPA